jgi:RND family efflux transporter MFP subunit
MRRLITWYGAAASVLASLAACGDEPSLDHLAASAPRASGVVIEIRDTVVSAVLEVAGIARPVRQATLSTRLAGTVLSVLAQEGQVVSEGQVLARLDDRDLVARREQTRAATAEAEAVLADARVQAERFRALYADSAAARVQLDAAETGLARAEAGVRMAHASSAELVALTSYAEVRAPFAGRVTRRLVDPGDFVAPGVPMIEVEDHSRLRIAAVLAPGSLSGLKAGTMVEARIESELASARIEGVVPAGNSLVQINALVDNRNDQYQPGGAATLLVPQGARPGIMIPLAAVVEQGDLTGVRVETAGGLDLRWVRLGLSRGDAVEVLSGLAAGDRVFVPGSTEGRR